MKTIRIVSVFEIDVSDKLYKRIRDEKELEQFCIMNCFRNNSRKLKKVNVIK